MNESTVEAQLENGIRQRVTDERYQQTLEDYARLLADKPSLTRSYTIESTYCPPGDQGSSLAPEPARTALDYGFQPLAKVESTVRFDPPYDKVIPATEVLYVCWSRPDGLKLDIHPDGEWSFLVVFANASAFTISARPGPGSDLPNRTGFVSSGSFEEDIVLAERLIDEATKSGKRPLLVVDRETLQLQHDVWESYLAFDPAGMFGGETREMLTSVESNPWPSRVGMVALLIFAGAIAVYVQSWLLFGVSLLVIASAKLLLDLTVRRWRQRIMESIDLDHPPQLSPGDSDVVEKSE